MYTYDQFLKDSEEIFKYTGKGPKAVMCTRCGDTVNSTKDNDCSCGYIGRIVRRILKNRGTNDRAD